MKKKPKGKQNWFKIQFKKHPYLFTFLIGWPILLYIIVEFIVPISPGDHLGIIFYSFPLIIFFLWFRKNKSKIKPFYKRNKKIFNRIYFYLGSVFSLIPIACIVGIIATGGVSNFIERVKFEINATMFTYHKFDVCQSPFVVAYTGYPKANRIYFFKEATQFLDYFKGTDLNYEMNLLKDSDLLNFNHCTGTRYLLKEAQKGNETAKEILVAYPPELRGLYQFPPAFFIGGEGENYIFSRYEKNIANMDLDNPAIAYSYAASIDKNISQWDYDVNLIKPEALKYLKQSAEDGYFLAMIDFTIIYSDDINFGEINCKTYLKYFNTLADNNSLIPYFMLMQGYMGKLTSPMPKTVFKCLGKKPNFSKAFSMLINRPTEGSHHLSKKSNNFNSSYPAIFYLYGLGDVEQDYDKAYELFSYSEDKAHEDWDYIPDHAYLAYMNFKGMGVQQNLNKGKGLTIELAKQYILASKEQDDINVELYCGGTNYKKNKNLDNLSQCLLESEHEVSIKFLEDYIFNRVSDFFKNPELVKTLNYLGEPK